MEKYLDLKKNDNNFYIKKYVYTEKTKIYFTNGMESTIQLETWHGYENINKINDKNMNIITGQDSIALLRKLDIDLIHIF